MILIILQCDICQHHFRRQHDLKRHRKLHTGERPYVCKRCSRPFARLDALNRHQRAEGGNACTSAVYHSKKVNAIERSRGASTPRRPIPQLHIAHPASQPLPDQPPSYPLPPQHHQHHQQYQYQQTQQQHPASNSSTPISSPPSQSPTSSGVIPTSTSPSSSSSTIAAPTPLRLPPLHTPSSPPPPPSHQHHHNTSSYSQQQQQQQQSWERLEHENRALKAQLQAVFQQKDALQSQVHDLQVEVSKHDMHLRICRYNCLLIISFQNKVLRSLIMDSQRPETTTSSPEAAEPALKRFRPSS